MIKKVLENVYITKIFEKSSYEFILTVNIENQYLELEYKNFWINYAKQKDIKGFRDGRLPLSLKKGLELRFAKEYPSISREEYINNLIVKNISNKICESNEFKENHILSSIYSDVKKLSNESLEFSLELTTFPNIKNIDISQYEVPNYQVKITEQDITNYLQDWVYTNYIGEPIQEDRPAQYGDLVKFDLITQIAGTDLLNSFTVRLGEGKMQEIENIIVKSKLKVNNEVKAVLKMNPNMKNRIQASRVFAHITVKQILQNAKYSNEEILKLMEPHTNFESVKVKAEKKEQEKIKHIQIQYLIDQILELPEFKRIDSVLGKTIKPDEYMEYSLNLIKNHDPIKYEQAFKLLQDISISNFKTNLIKEQFNKNVQFSSVEFAEFLKQIFPQSDDIDIPTIVNEIRDMPDMPEFEHLQKMFSMQKSLDSIIEKVKMKSEVEIITSEEATKKIQINAEEKYAPLLKIYQEIINNTMEKSKDNISLEGLSNLLDILKTNPEIQNSKLVEKLENAIKTSTFESFEEELQDIITELSQQIEKNPTEDNKENISLKYLQTIIENLKSHHQISINPEIIKKVENVLVNDSSFDMLDKEIDQIPIKDSSIKDLENLEKITLKKKSIKSKIKIDKDTDTDTDTEILAKKKKRIATKPQDVK